MVLNHSSSAITRRYLGITKVEIADIYEDLILNYKKYGNLFITTTNTK
jgi:helix-turn-helix protein